MPDYTESEIEAALEDCAREPVHSPNAIQPNGCLISTDLALEKICQVSANLEDILGITPANALAEDPVQLLGTELVQRLRSRSNDADAPPVSVSLVRLSVRGVERNFSARHYVSGQRVVIELERQEADVRDDQLPSRSAWLQPVSAADSPEQLLERLVQTVRQLTGYERVMVYQFDDDDHGRVVAESLTPKQTVTWGITFQQAIYRHRSDACTASIRCAVSLMQPRLRCLWCRTRIRLKRRLLTFPLATFGPFRPSTWCTSRT